jgi:hypothetical protein
METLVAVILSFPKHYHASAPTIVYSIMQLQVIPSALFFIVPVFSAILLYSRLLTQSAASKSRTPESRDIVSRPLVAYFAYVSFGILSMVAGALGIAASTYERHGAYYASLDAGGRVIVALIKYECECFIFPHFSPILCKNLVGISVIYIFSTTIPCNVISHFKVLLFNLTLSLFLACGKYNTTILRFQMLILINRYSYHPPLALS